jgi:hypothetical protein
VATIAPCVKDRSIDEVYADPSHVRGESRDLALRIKQPHPDFGTVRATSKLPAASADARGIRRAARERQPPLSLDHKLRLLGVRAYGLSMPDPRGCADPPRQAELPFALSKL